MTSSLSSPSEKTRFDITIRKLCSFIEKNIFTDFVPSEYYLRRELVACILGSQVRYEMALSALKRIENSGLLDDKWWYCISDNFESKVFDLLSGNTLLDPDKFCYRFPKIRAHQLTKARNTLAGQSLSQWLCITSDPKCMRQKLVINISGLGPKQASMFLRNIGKSYDLAILDTHVIRFMNMKNLLHTKPVNIGTLSSYERVEKIFVDYADTLGCPVGYLDLAIWATMRAAKELGL